MALLVSLDAFRLSAESKQRLSGGVDFKRIKTFNNVEKCAENSCPNLVGGCFAMECYMEIPKGPPLDALIAVCMRLLEHHLIVRRVCVG